MDITYSGPVIGYLVPPITKTISGKSAMFEQSSLTSIEPRSLSNGLDGPVKREVPVSATTLHPCDG
jgi:hypothetical protein